MYYRCHLYGGKLESVIEYHVAWHVQQKNVLAFNYPGSRGFPSLPGTGPVNCGDIIRSLICLDAETLLICIVGSEHHYLATKLPFSTGSSQIVHPLLLSKIEIVFFIRDFLLLLVLLTLFLIQLIDFLKDEVNTNDSHIEKFFFQWNNLILGDMVSTRWSASRHIA